MNTLEYDLIDDGTLDTVVEVHCTVCDKTWEERFSQEYASNYRDPDSGDMIGLVELVADSDLWCDCEED